MVMLLLAAFLSGVASAEYTNTKNLTMDLTQSVNGEGYFMSYTYAKMPNALGLFGTDENGVEALEYSHGSGTIDIESLLSAESSFLEEGINSSYGYDYTEALSCIQMREDNLLTYHPVTMSIGTGFYAHRPLEVSSLLKEKTWIVNRGSATSMHHEVEYAHGLDKEKDILLKDFISFEDPSVTMMNISEYLTDGHAHIGMIQGDIDAITSETEVENEEDEPEVFVAKTAWRNPLSVIDEDYWGTYQIKKLMNLTASVEGMEDYYDWLPCCSGGWNDMTATDKRGFGGSTNGIFDCSCFKVPEKAEF